MSAFIYETTLEIEPEDESIDCYEVPVRVECNLIPYRRATHIDPEEGGVEIEGVYIDGHLVGAEHPAYERLCEEAEIAAGEEAQEEAAAHGDYLYEQMKDRQMEEKWESKK